MFALESGPHPKAKYIFECFQPTPLPCRHEDLTRNPKTLTIWLIGDGGALLGAFQKLGDGQFIMYPAQELGALGKGAHLRQLLHQTLHQMSRDQQPSVTDKAASTAGDVVHRAHTGTSKKSIW